jgi:hypothetical protein
MLIRGVSYIHIILNFTRLTLFNETVDFLLIKEIDFIATGLAMTLSRSHVIDFTFPFESDPINLLVPYPRKNSTLGSILDPFQYKVSYIPFLPVFGYKLIANKTLISTNEPFFLVCIANRCG